MHNRYFHLGIDLGSISLKVVLLNESLEICFERWVRVAGKPIAALSSLLNECECKFPGAVFKSIGVTGSGRGLVAGSIPSCEINEISAHAAASSSFNPEIRTIIEIGGQDSKLIILEAPKGEGRFTNYESRFTNHDSRRPIKHFAMNELCAAGTGAFLDQQATRLGISIEKFAQIGANAGTAASIAGRCAVFAKTDMTHLQQEGRPLPEIVAGLNEALARSYLSNMVRGRKLPRPIAFQGGVAANEGLIAAFKKLLDLKDAELSVPKHYKVMGAIGAAMLAAEKSAAEKINLSDIAAKIEILAKRQDSARPKETSRKRLARPNLAPIEPNFGRLNINGTYLGIDVGSVSVKIAVIGPNGLLFSDYRFSEGRPLDSLRSIFSDFARAHPDFKPDGVGVTGSGRHFIGKLICADLVQNEITAQVGAARFLMPDCDTVIEIGGQDAKFMRLVNGRPSHFAMNRVCAAGTGAFLQEQAARLEIDLEKDFSELAFASNYPAELGARCTVFMESDLVSHQQQGFEKRDLVAGLAMSVVINYCDKVVQGHEIGERILFLGGVAQNSAVVAALNARLKRIAATSIYGRISGAIGVAIATANANKAGKFAKSKFKSGTAALDVKNIVCEDCSNHCSIMQTISEPIRFFGGRCGKWDNDSSRSLNVAESLLKQRNKIIFGLDSKFFDRRSLITGHRSPKIGIPRALLAYDLYPAWRAFFEELGCEVVLSPETNNEMLADGLKHLVVETCLPTKVFCAHLRWLENKGVDFIFVPSLVMMNMDIHKKETVHCPYVQGLFELARPITKTPILNPVINWKIDPNDHAREMANLAVKLGRTRQKGELAWKKAQKLQNEVYAKIKDIGREVLAKLSRKEIPRAFVILGKDYNINDRRLSLGAVDILESRGETVISQDMIADDSGAYSAAYRTMYWSHGKEILAAAEIAAKTPNLYPIMITSFGCGPDSFTIGFLRDIIGEKPMLLLEVDEHSSSTGVETRIEAFLDSLAGAPEAKKSNPRGPFIPSRGLRKVFLPNFSAHGYAFAATIRSLGLEPILTPLPNEESARIGSELAVSGECHPYVLMLGDYIKTASTINDISNVCYFMPESGACRVGQFGAQMRIAGEKARAKLPVFTRIEDIVASTGRISKGSYLRAVTAYWQMMRGMDFFIQMHLERRAREITPGSADCAHAEALDILMKYILEDKPLDGLEKARAKLAEVEIDRAKKLVKIGITGDYYTRICDFANTELFREIERMGGIVMIPPTMSDFVKYESHQRTGSAIKHRNIEWLAQALVLRGTVGRLERKVREIFEGYLDYDVPLDYNRAKKLIEPYMSMKLPGGLTGSVAAILEQLHAGANGIVNAITFHCTYGLVVGSVLSQIDCDWPHVPKLTLIYEGLKPTHNRLRLEAFMERVRASSTL